MTGEQYQSWRLTDEERRRLVVSAMQAAPTFAGPVGPLASLATPGTTSSPGRR